MATIPLKLMIAGEGEEGSTFEVPVLRDMYGFSPVALSLGMDELPFADYSIFRDYELKVKLSPEDPGHEKPLTKAVNLEMAILIFQRLSKYGFMHSSYEVNHSVLHAIKIALPDIGVYLESLFKEAKHVFQKNSQRSIKSDQIRTSEAYGEYASLNMASWV